VRRAIEDRKWCILLNDTADDLKPTSHQAIHDGGWVRRWRGENQQMAVRLFVEIK